MAYVDVWCIPAAVPMSQVGDLRHCQVLRTLIRSMTLILVVSGITRYSWLDITLRPRVSDRVLWVAGCLLCAYRLHTKLLCRCLAQTERHNSAEKGSGGGRGEGEAQSLSKVVIAHARKGGIRPGTTP